MSEWGWSRVLKNAVAEALLEELNRVYVEHIGSLVKPDGTPVPIVDRIAVVASSRAVSWIFPAREYVAISKVPSRLASVMTLKDLANLVGGIYWESEGVVLVKPDALAAFITARETRITQLLSQA